MDEINSGPREPNGCAGLVIVVLAWLAVGAFGVGIWIGGNYQ